MNLAPITSSAALLTPVGRGAVATIRVRGELSVLDAAISGFFRAVNGRQLRDQVVGDICYGHWVSEVSEDLVVCRTDACSVEIQSHGGISAPQRILRDLAGAGIPVVDWQAQESAARQRVDVECLGAITQAKTSRTAGWLMSQQGRFPQALRELAAAARELTPQSEAGSWQTLLKQIDALLCWADFGVHLVEPWQIAIVGRPNVGKSTLLNGLLGYRRAIVFDEPGTTRDLVTGETAFAGWPVQLADTAGLRETSDELESAGIARARAALEAADCRYFVFDLSQPLTPDDVRLLELAKTQPRSLLIGNKTDLASCWWAAESSALLTADWVMLSAETGDGVDELIERTARILVPKLPESDAAFPVTRQQVELLQAARSACERRAVDDLRGILCE